MLIVLTWMYIGDVALWTENWKIMNTAFTQKHVPFSVELSGVLTPNMGLLYVSGSEAILCHSWLNPILWYIIITQTTVFHSVPLEQQVQIEGLAPKLFSGTIRVYTFADQWLIVMNSHTLTTRPGSESIEKARVRSMWKRLCMRTKLCRLQLVKKANETSSNVT